MANLVLPAEMLERLNKPRRPCRGKRTGMSSFQTHKVIHHTNGKRTRIPRQMHIQGEVPLLGNSYQDLQQNYGNKAHKEWYVSNSKYYKKRVGE